MEHLKVLEQKMKRLKSEESAAEHGETLFEQTNGTKKLKKKIRDTELEIRRIESVVSTPKQNETLVEHPAALDFISKIDELQKFISETEKSVEELEKNMTNKESDEYDEWTNRKIQALIKPQKSDVTTAKDSKTAIIDFGLPRCIATYSCGLHRNYSTSAGTFYVDAAIAKISDDERDHILSKRNKKGSVYGFHNEKKINGEIVPLAELEKESDKDLSFWKSGRTTSHTEGGKLSLHSHFFINLKGFKQKICYGEFTNVQFKTYCQTCASQIECDLVETTLLKKLKCEKCKEDIEEESPGKELWAYNCFLVFRKQGPFAEKGDSGAVIFDEEGRAWGIIVGVFDNYYSYTVAIPLDVALQALGEQLGKKLKLWCVNPA